MDGSACMVVDPEQMEAVVDPEMMKLVVDPELMEVVVDSERMEVVVDLELMEAVVDPELMKLVVDPELMKLVVIRTDGSGGATDGIGGTESDGTKSDKTGGGSGIDRTGGGSGTDGTGGGTEDATDDGTKLTDGRSNNGSANIYAVPAVILVTAFIF